MVTSTTEVSTPDTLPAPEPAVHKPTGSPFHVNIARGLTVAASLGVALLVAVTFRTGWHDPATSGHVAISNLGMILTVCGYLGALWARGQHHRKVADEHNRTILLQDVTNAVRSICVEAAQDCRRQHRQIADELTATLENDVARRATAVERMRREVSEMRSIVAGSFSKAGGARSDARHWLHGVDSAAVARLEADVVRLAAQQETLAEMVADGAQRMVLDMPNGQAYELGISVGEQRSARKTKPENGSRS